jgi:hypothetical protein
MPEITEDNLLHAARCEDLKDNEIKEVTVLGKFEQDIVRVLQQPGAHLLQGARGVGKSMLLKAAELELDKDFYQRKVLPIYVSFKSSTLLEGVKLSNRDGFQVWVIAKVLKGLHEKLLFHDLIKAENIDDPYNRLFGIQRTDSISTLLEEKIQKINSITLSPDREQTLKDIGDEFLSKVNDISYIKSIIDEIIKRFDLKRIIFLFDEVAHTFIPAQQEIFFEIFKLLHGNAIAVKAAVYPTITSYGRNFEIGQDAISIQMDDRFETTENMRDFFRNMLLKRIENITSLKKKIFEHLEILDSCILIASGNPRAFFHILIKTLEVGYSESGLFSAAKSYVDNELLPYHNQLVRRLPKYSNHVLEGLNLLRNYVIKEIRTKNERGKYSDTQSSFFAIEREVSPNLKLALDILCYSGILTKSRTVRVTNETSGQRYIVHLALMVAEKGFRTGLKLNEALRSINVKDYKKFTASDAQIQEFVNNVKTPSLYCSSCGVELLPTAKFCSECGSKVIDNVTLISKLLEEPIASLSLSEKIKSRIVSSYPKIGNIIQAHKEELMKISYIKEKRAKLIKNSADEFISG